MSELAEIKARLDRLEARAALEELVSAFALACDAHDLPAVIRLFTPDARIEGADGLPLAAGRVAIEALFIEQFRRQGPSCHWTHDTVVHLDPTDPDRASGRVYCHAECAEGPLVQVAALRYADDYQRDDGRWRFRRRRLEYLYRVPATEYPVALASFQRVASRGERRAADYPETSASWQQFAVEYDDLAT